MTCGTCGDKPKKNRHFPSAVVEINNPEQLVLLRKVVIPSSLGDDTVVPPTIGKYRNVVLVYEANKHIYFYSSDGIPTLLETEVPQEVLDRIANLELDVDLLETSLAVETDARERADQGLQQEIDDLKNSPDVVDIVATYADLMAYDTQHLGNNDVIRVLRDETHEGQSSYYRWDKPHSTWTFIGTVGDYYTKQQVDTLLDGKQDELTPGENVSIVDESGELVISATDTTYDNFVGTDGTTAGRSGLVPAPSIVDAGKVLGANGAWVVGGPAVVQTEGDSTTDVMSQAATTVMKGKPKTLTSADYNWPVGAEDGIALWLLPEGWYQVENGIKTYYSAVVGRDVSVNHRTILVSSDGANAGIHVFIGGDIVEVTTRANGSEVPHSFGGVLKTSTVVDNLNASTAEFPLSANQGRILDEKIAEKQDELTAGTGISIADESGALVISATGAVARTINAQDWSNLWQ